MIPNLDRAAKAATPKTAPVPTQSNKGIKGKNFSLQLASLVRNDTAAHKTSAARGRSRFGTPASQFVGTPAAALSRAPLRANQPETAQPAPASSATTTQTITNPFYTGGTYASIPVQPRPGPEHATPWAPYTGPTSDLDGVPPNGGKVTASGAPEIRPNAGPVKNQYNYKGPAAHNPYFTSPGNPLRPGYVLGFENWFEENWIVGGNKAMPAPLNKINCATEEGAREALRLVQLHVPGAKIANSSWGSEGGPFVAIKPTWEIELPNGVRMNAGGILNTYYNQGWGVTIASDAYLAQHTRMV